MFASGNPNCVSILACGECLGAKCVSTCRNYHVSRRLDKVQFILKNRDHSFNNRSLLRILSRPLDVRSKIKEHHKTGNLISFCVMFFFFCSFVCRR